MTTRLAAKLSTRSLSILAAGALAVVALVAAGQALAAKPLTQKQFAEARLKQALNTWARKTVPGLAVGSVSCVLPENGVVLHCTAKASAPKYRENLVFKVTETLHETGVMSWAITSRACSDSRTGKSIQC